ncbi:MAG: type II secretion system F family protein [Candidatus Brocadiales bacterium]
MPTFKYKVRDSRGKAIVGTLEANGPDIARMRLSEMGYIPVTVEVTRAKKGKGLALNPFRRKVGTKDLIVFNRQLATLFAAGIPLLRAIQTLAEQIENKAFQEILQQVARDIQAGKSFSDSLTKYPATFPDVYVNMIRAGEASGTLDDILNRLAALAEHEAETKAKIKQATRYPKIVIGALVIAVCILMRFVVPNFIEIFKDVELELPLATRILVFANGIFNNYWYIIFGAAVGTYFAFRAFARSKWGRQRLDKLSITIPIFGPLFLKMAMSSFARTMATLNRSGLPILKNLEICASVVGNVVVAEVVDKLRESVKEGKGLASTAKESKIFPPMVVQMMSAGEESGELDNMLTKVSEYYDSEVDNAIKNLSSLIEPILLAFLGIGVLFLMLAVFLPMWDLTKIAQR